MAHSTIFKENFEKDSVWKELESIFNILTTCVVKPPVDFYGGLQNAHGVRFAIGNSFKIRYGYRYAKFPPKSILPDECSDLVAFASAEIFCHSSSEISIH